MKILLDRYRINENSEVNPPAKKAKLDDKADEGDNDQPVVFCVVIRGSS